MIPLVTAQLRRYRPDEIGVVASPKMANEDFFLLRRLVDHLGLIHVDFRVPPRTPGDEDRILIKADKNPNTRGAELIGLGPRPGGLDARGMLRAARDRRIKCLWVFHVPTMPVDTHIFRVAKRLGLARGGSGGCSTGRRVFHLPGFQFEWRERGRALRSAQRRLGGARRDVHELRGARPALLEGRGAPGARPRRLGDPHGFARWHARPERCHERRRAAPEPRLSRA